MSENQRIDIGGITILMLAIVFIATQSCNQTLALNRISRTLDKIAAKP